MEDQLEHAWKIKDYISQYIQFADTKASLSIGISTLSLALLSILPDDLSRGEAIFISLSFIPLFISALLSIVVIFPRTKSNFTQGTIFWKSISSYCSFDNYKNNFHQSDPLEEVLKQVFELSQIANKKYYWISRAICFQVPGLLLFCITIFLIRIF